MNILNNLKPENVFMDPFPHLIIENALPENVYSQLESSFPGPEFCEELCVRKKARSILNDPSVNSLWVDFVDYHTSDEFFHQALDVLNFEVPPGSVGVRNLEGGDYVTDVSSVTHKPINTTTRTPHLDNPVEIYAGLLYMKHSNDVSSGGGFVIHSLEYVKSLFGKSYEVTVQNPVKYIPYKANNFVMFLNTRNSIHSVEPRDNPIMVRRSVNIIGEYNNGSVMWQP